MSRRVVIFGPQGSGKSTHGRSIASVFDLRHLSVGNILRQEIQDASSIGRAARDYIDSGQFVPDKIVIPMILQIISVLQKAGQGFLLDGFPRNLAQHHALNEAVTLTDALSIELADSEAIRRISNRRSCICGEVFNLVDRPPKQSHLCDVCGLALFIREDDKPDVVSQRLTSYRTFTEPILSDYRRRGILRIIDGSQPIALVGHDILSIMTQSVQAVSA